MFQMRVSDAVISIVEAMLPVGSEDALHIHLHLRMEHPKAWKNKSKGQAATHAHFVFARPSSHTKVWFAEGDWNMPNIADFKMTSDHDSCWTTDGVESPISKAYFRMAEGINSKMAPKDMIEFCQVREIERVKVEWESVDPHDSHMKRLVSVEVMK